MNPKTRNQLVGLAVLGVGGFFAWRRWGSSLGGDWITRAIRNLEKWEGLYTFPYLDTKGLPTTGIGNLATNPYAIAWTIDGHPATRPEIDAAYKNLKSYPPAKVASYYKDKTKLRITEAYARALSAARVRGEFIPALRSLYPAFDTFPDPVKIGLVDMIYSLGKGGLAKFNTLRVALGRRDFRAAALASMRSGGRPARNEYVQKLLTGAA